MEEIRLFSDCYSCHDDQVDCVIVATARDLAIGKLCYCVFGGELHISFVEVEKRHRRRGIATQTLRQMEADNPDLLIQWGMTTVAGTKLQAGYVASCDKKGN